MKKWGSFFYFFIGVIFLFFGLLIDLQKKSSLTDNPTSAKTSIAIGNKVYPKVSTLKGLAHDLYLPENPTPAVIKINEAKQAYFEERYQDSCDLWREALNLNPKHPNGIWHDIGLCSIKLKAWDDAIQAYTESIRLDNEVFHKNYPSTYWGRGYAYLKSDNLNPNNIEAAEKDFLQAISIDAHFIDAYYQLALIEESKDNLEKAIFYLNKILEDNPDHTPTKKLKIQLLRKLNKEE